MQEGTYYCQPTLQGGPPLLPSKHQMLGPAGAHDSLPTCNGERVSVPSMRCAVDIQDHTNFTNMDNKNVFTMENNDTVALNDSGLPEIDHEDGTQEPTNGSGTQEATNGSGTQEPTNGSGTQEPTNGSGTQEPTNGSGTQESTNGSTSAFPVWVVIAASGAMVLVLLVCVGATFSAVYCHRRKHKAAAAKSKAAIGKTYPG